MLEITDIQAGYDRVEVLRGIDLSIQEGEVVCLLGANGAGKSTLLKCISGLIVPTGGSIRFRGQEISRTRPNEIVRAGLSHVPERRQIFTTLSVQQNLLLGAYVLGGKKSEMDRRYHFVFEMFPILEERFTKKAGILSGGEQQMLAIARGLMSQPKLLLLDEPSLGLAPLVVDHIFGILKGLKNKGIPILLVEQNVQAALKILDRAYILETGRISGLGGAATLMADAEIARRYLGIRRSSSENK